MSDTGWKNPGTMESISIAFIPWDSPDNAKVSDNIYTSCSGGSADGSDTLKASNFNFNIPTGATIDGVEVEVEQYGTNVSGTYSVNQLGFDYSFDIWPESDTYVNFGGPTDLWNQELNSEIVNSPSFYFTVEISGSSYGLWVGYIDHIRAKIYYTESTTPVIGQKYALPAFRWSTPA